jgi:hypothetical protein
VATAENCLKLSRSKAEHELGSTENQRSKPNLVENRYFFLPRITRSAPESKAKAPEALPVLISGAAMISAMAKLAVPIKIRDIPAAINIVAFSL